MSFWDNVKKFAQPYADDEYDDYDEDDEYLDDYEEPARPARRSGRRPNPVTDPVEEELEEEPEFSFAPAPVAATTSNAPAATGFNGRLVGSSHAGPKQEVVLFRPTNFGSTSKAADELRSRRAIVLNLEEVDHALSRRVVDFLSGCVYAMDGKVKKIAQSVYLFCPPNMDVVGDLESIQAEVESYI